MQFILSPLEVAKSGTNLKTVSHHVFSPPRKKTHSPGLPLVLEAVFPRGTIEKMAKSQPLVDDGRKKKLVESKKKGHRVVCILSGFYSLGRVLS